MDNYKPQAFPVGDSISAIAPFWTPQDHLVSFEVLQNLSVEAVPSQLQEAINATVNTDQPGQVYFKQYYRYGTQASFYTLELLDAIGIEISKYTATQFQANLAVVATWKDVTPEPYWHYSGSQNATYQLIIVSDLTKAYAMIIYDKINFGGNYQNFRQAYNGFTDGNNFNYYNTFVSGTGAMFFLDQIQGNTGEIGKWLFPLFHSYETADENYAQQCIEWFNTQDSNAVLTANTELHDCPCRLDQALIDPRFKPSASISSEKLCVVTTFASSTNAGRECCYSWLDGALNIDQTNAGFLQLYHEDYYNEEHQREDKLPYSWCCENSQLCDYYELARPISTSENYIPLSATYSIGDPHIETLDGFYYTFNGLGEYILLDTDNVMLQGRTGIVSLSNSTNHTATVWNAFAAQENSSDQLQVTISEDKKGLEVYVEEDLVPIANLLNSVNVDDGVFKNLFLQMNSSTTLTASFKSGFSLTVSVSAEMLHLSVTLPAGIPSKGLLGNVNGNITDDLTLPDGALVPITANESEIFEYGQAWQVTNITSIFWYLSGQSMDTFYDPNFKPAFLSDFSDSERKQAEQLCGSPQLVDCIYDYLVTQNEIVANNTKQLHVQEEIIEETIENSSPTLSLPSVISATVDKLINFTIDVNDIDSDPVDITFETDASGAVFNTTTKNFFWTPKDTSPVSIRFYATDNKGARSPTYRVYVQMCNGCSDQGRCDFIFLESVNQTSSFSKVDCDCDIGWEGEFCSVDSDGCARDPCDGLNCTDLTPEDEAIQRIDYICVSCPVGFVQEGSFCVDVDECKNNSGICDQICVNNQGSYNCQCNPGYSNNNQNNTCQDIDECLLGTSGCSQLCTNTPGSYSCGCRNTYYINPNDTSQCVLNETALKCNKSCDFGCEVIESVDTCFCGSGYELNADNVTCDDVDECNATNLCEQKCINYPGGYNCSCNAGYTLAGDGYSCSACDAIHWGLECSNICSCGDRAQRCDKAAGCVVCQPGWRGEQCADNVNECNETQEICGQFSICSDTQGSYICTCIDGFSQNESGICIDVDECLTQGCGPNSICINIQGSLTPNCSCKAGFFNNSNGICEDIDECSNLTNPCTDPNARCTNRPGSYLCTCETGYIGNQTICQDIDECAESSSCPINRECVNKIGSYECIEPITSTTTPPSTEPVNTTEAETTPATDVSTTTITLTDPCSAALPCKNGGTCYREESSQQFTCLCAPGFGGPLCSKSTLEYQTVAPLTTTYTADLAVPTSEAYLALAAKVCAEVDSTYQTSSLSSVYLRCQVTGFTPRSVVENNTAANAAEVKYTIVFSQETERPVTAQEAKDRFTALVATSDILVNISNGLSSAELTTILGNSTIFASSTTSALIVSDIDECASSELNDCDANAICSNSAGSFTCSCNSGFSDIPATNRPGRICTEQCNDTTCLNDGVCLERLGNTTECICKDGFIGETCAIQVLSNGLLEWQIIVIAISGGFALIMLILGCTVCCSMYYKRFQRRKQLQKRYLYQRNTDFRQPIFNEVAFDNDGYLSEAGSYKNRPTQPALTGEVPLSQVAEAVDQFRDRPIYLPQLIPGPTSRSRGLEPFMTLGSRYATTSDGRSSYSRGSSFFGRPISLPTGPSNLQRSHSEDNIQERFFYEQERISGEAEDAMGPGPSGRRSSIDYVEPTERSYQIPRPQLHEEYF
ncbi:unnamed protein product [Owenia fusiformis]|uniref:Uncharacterized protein n=1 Tax=Owenia fusiformis TaxID=6347 RepID=A0A8J1UCF6_OWEFU|nr:unnamed protein product [Owenia fusiformis]